jgi:hypothetical protein
MTEEQREAPDRPEAERYYAQHASLDAGEGGTSEAALQEAINEGARQSWKLISVTQDPMSGGVLLVWDTSGSSRARAVFGRSTLQPAASGNRRRASGFLCGVALSLVGDVPVTEGFHR